MFNLGKSGFVAVSPAAKELGADGPHERLYAEINVTEAGYVYAYLSNDAPTPIEVYVACPDKVGDDFSVTHVQSPIVAGADYYPYGLVMEGREITDEAYRYGYQGQYAEKDETTGYNEFQLRFYDAKIGRFLSVDPYGQFYSSYMPMGNAPHMNVDLDGGWCTTCFQGVSQLLADPLFQAMASGATILNNVTISAARSTATSVLIGSISRIILRDGSKSWTAASDPYQYRRFDNRSMNINIAAPYSFDAEVSIQCPLKQRLI